MKPTIHRIPIKSPSEPDTLPQKKKWWHRQSHSKVTKLHKSLLEQLQEQDGEQSTWARIKEVVQDFGHDMHERMINFFGTCLGEIVLLIVSTALIAGFIVLILKLTGNI